MMICKYTSYKYRKRTAPATTRTLFAFTRTPCCFSLSISLLCRRRPWTIPSTLRLRYDQPEVTFVESARQYPHARKHTRGHHFHTCQGSLSPQAPCPPTVPPITPMLLRRAASRERGGPSHINYLSVVVAHHPHSTHVASISLPVKLCPFPSPIRPLFSMHEYTAIGIGIIIGDSLHRTLSLQLNS